MKRVNYMEMHADITGVDQPADPRTLISVFISCSLENSKGKVATSYFQHSNKSL